MRIKPASSRAHQGTESAPDDLAEGSPAPSGHGQTPLRVARILVPFDFSDSAHAALEYAACFAEQFKASLVLFHVVEPSVVSEHYLQMTPVLDETNAHLVEGARERLVKVCGRKIGNRLPCEVLVRIGRAPSEIVDTARALGVDLVIMSTHGHSGIKHALLGSTAEKVVRHAACPVLTVRAGH